MHEVSVGAIEQSTSTEASPFAPTTEDTPAPSTPSSTDTVDESPVVQEPSTLKEDEVALTMTELIDLRAKLKKAEEEFRDYSLEVETKLLNLRNTVHVKKIMYEHLRQQLSQTRQEWSDAYDEHVELDQKKKQEVEIRLANIESLRKQIDNIESAVRRKVRRLELDDRTD